MPRNVIQEYLVSLGWSIDDTSKRRFDDALKLSAVKAEKFGKDITLGFLSAGSAFAALAAGVVGGGIAMANSLAKQDLSYQLLARRMFMGTESARKMQIALDALGVSLEDVIFGPPELQERYRTLLSDQDRMMKSMGGFGNVETAMRRVRDITFQFTRMGPELQAFGIAFTEDVLNKLTGRPESLEARLRELNDWFQSPQGFVRIADKITDVLVPAFKKLWDVGEKLFTKKNVDWVVNIVTKGFDTLHKDYEFITSPDKLGLIWDKDKSFSQNIGDLAGTANSRDEFIGKAAAAAKRHGGTPDQVADFLALIEHESGFINRMNPNKSGAIGLGQVMPFNSEGKNLYDPDQNLDVAADLFFNSLKQHRGNTRQALNDYYGHGTPPPGDPTFDQYYQQWLNQRKEFSGTNNPAMYQPQAYHPGSAGGGVTINGGVHVSVPASHMTPEGVASAVQDGIQKAARIEGARMYATAQGAYA